MKLPKQHRDTIKLLTTITKLSDDWKSYAYRLNSIEFAVTDGVRLLTLDLSDVVPDSVQCFDPDWALISDNPWNCPIDSDRVTDTARKLAILIPSGEQYRSTICDKFQSPRFWSDLGKVKDTVKCYLEIPTFNLQTFWVDKNLGFNANTNHAVNFRLASDKVYSPKHYTIALDLRLLSPMANSLIEFWPCVGSPGRINEESIFDSYKLKPMRFQFKLKKGSGRAGCMVIMPMRG